MDAVTGTTCFPHWANSRDSDQQLVAGVEMKAYVAGESPKTMTVETSDGKKGPWRPVASLSADSPRWGEACRLGGRVSEPDPARRPQLRLGPGRPGGRLIPRLRRNVHAPRSTAMRRRLEAYRKLVQETEARPAAVLAYAG